MGRFARNLAARASGGTVTLSRLWPGRADIAREIEADIERQRANRSPAEKAGRVLDLYERRWQGRRLRPGADRVTGFQEHHRENARPFQWTFTRQDLHRLTARLEHDGRLTPAA